MQTTRSLFRLHALVLLGLLGCAPLHSFCLHRGPALRGGIESEPRSTGDFQRYQDRAEYEIALTRLQHGDRERAEIILQQILDRNPNHREARELLAQARSPTPVVVENLTAQARQAEKGSGTAVFPVSQATALDDPPVPLDARPEPHVAFGPEPFEGELVQPEEEPLISLHLDDVEVRKALELLSRQGPCNILVSSRVSGRVTANLENVTLEQALDALLKLTSLVARRENKLIYVFTPQEHADLLSRDQQVATRVFQLKYLRGADLEKMATPFLSNVGRISITPVSEVGIQSDTDRVGGDSMAGGEAVVIQDYESVLQTIQEIVTKLDVQPVQILVEAVILEVALEHSTDLGVNFAVLDSSHKMIAVAGSAATLNSGVGFLPAQLLTAGGHIGGTTDGLAANTHGIKFGFIDKDVTGFIRALESFGQTRVLASPRLLVLNKQRAELIIGDRIGYKTLTVTETSTVERVEFLAVGTQLRLRPYVAENGIIRMEIHPERSSGVVVDGVPSTSTSEVTTNVLVPDGATIVIGGLLEDTERLSQSGIPYLSRLPYIGWLFRREIRSAAKKELIVLLTPRTWNPAAPEEIPMPAELSSTPQPVHVMPAARPRPLRR